MLQAFANQLKSNWGNGMPSAGMSESGSQVPFSGKTDPEPPYLLTTFRLGGDHFCLDTRWVQEILSRQPITPVPLAPEYVAGLINLRGQIVMAVHLKKLLYLHRDDLPSDSMNIVIRQDEDAISLLVDDVDDVIEASPQAVQPVPETLNNIRKEYVSGVIPLQDKLVLMLDLQKIVMVS